MGMSDCIKCWDTPCLCGYEYRNQTKEYRISQACVILGINEDQLEKVEIPIKHPRNGEK